MNGGEPSTEVPRCPERRQGPGRIPWVCVRAEHDGDAHVMEPVLDSVEYHRRLP